MTGPLDADLARSGRLLPDDTAAQVRRDYWTERLYSRLPDPPVFSDDEISRWKEAAKTKPYPTCTTWRLYGEALQAQKAVDDAQKGKASLDELADLLWRRAEAMCAFEDFQEDLAERWMVGFAQAVALKPDEVANVVLSIPCFREAVAQGMPAVRESLDEILQKKPNEETLSVMEQLKADVKLLQTEVRQLRSQLGSKI